MAATPPWSVKGVDRDARDIAKRAAQASGQTLGIWLAEAIRAFAEAQAVHAAESNSWGDPAAPAPAAAAAAPVDDGRIAEIEERLARLEAALNEHRERSEHALADLARGFVALAEKRSAPPAG